MESLKRNLHFLSAFGAPFRFSFGTGHFLSALRSRAVDRKGRPLPWYTYPSITFLSQISFSDADVLEFGGGQSTLWWGQRARSVVCMESNEGWCVELRKRNNIPGIEINHVRSPSDAAEILGDRFFDVIVVDDGSGIGPHGRVSNVETAFAKLKPNGLIIVDNTDAQYCWPILHLAFQLGYSRIDFVGWAPGSLGQSCTSLLIKGSSSFLQYSTPPQVC